MPLEIQQMQPLLDECEPLIKSLYEECVGNAPNFGVDEDCFRDALAKGMQKFLCRYSDELPSLEEAREFLDSVKTDDLFLALGCANGNERAWWEFDHQHRGYLERVARHLASSDLNAQEVVDHVYVELYGTRMVDGERMSKFATYSGKGSIRGWLRTVVWHGLVDLHRASHDQVSLDAMTESVGEGYAHSTFAETDLGGEDSMLDHVAHEKYKRATVSAMEKAFASLDDHEKLLLLYYHAEDMKLREIARLAESPDSPLRDWFQRRSAAREKNPSARIHESTIMRWLGKTYKTVLESFRDGLRSDHGLSDEEIEVCTELATQDFGDPNLYANLAQNA